MGSHFGLAPLIASRGNTSGLRLTARVGIVAGLVRFLIHAVSQLGQAGDPDSRVAQVPGLLVRPPACEIAVVFLFFGRVRVLSPMRLLLASY